MLQALVTAGAFFILPRMTVAQNSFDSLKIKQPKHYFKTVIILDSYTKPKQKITDTLDFLSRKLGSYGIKEFIFSLNTPIATYETKHADGTISNTHVLLTANYVSLEPVFDKISQHKLVKSGVGARVVFNNGKKGVWFIDAAPFITKDATYTSKPYLRLAETIVYSHNPSDHFNWRLGVTKSFMWGNRLFLPFIGVRFGRLDKVNLSIQVPRSISVNIPFNSKFSLSAYTKPQGGMYNFSNHDSLYYMGNDATFHFTRYEINTGLRADVRIKDWFTFYLATGVSTKNNITFYSEHANAKRPRLPYNTYFYSQTLPSTLFLNFGLTFKFGKTKSFYNNKNIYDAIDLNNTIGVGDENVNDGNSQIPIAPKKKSDLNLKSVQDLIDYNDY
jgi:hypothetical protein